MQKKRKPSDIYKAGWAAMRAVWWTTAPQPACIFALGVTGGVRVQVWLYHFIAEDMIGCGNFSENQ